MKTKIIFLLLLASFIFLSAYEREQVSRYAHRYTRLTEGYSYGYSPDSLWWNVNPFIYDLEVDNGAHADTAGYYDEADCSHFVSQCLQAGGIPIYEDGHNDLPYLGAINCKNLHLIATELFPVTREDWYHTTFRESLWIEEVINPVIESSHFPYFSCYNFLDFCSDIYFLKIYFSSIGLGYEDDINVSLPHENNYYIYGFHTGFWTDLLSNYYNGEYDPIVYASIILHDNAPTGNNHYGFQANAIKWQANYYPHSDYQQGDFQIYCNYRTDNENFVSDFEIFYENTYNDIGRTIRYRHAAICKSGSGNTARVSAHNKDRNDKSWDFDYCHNDSVYIPLKHNSITFYNVDNSDGDKPNLCAYNNWGTKSIITTSDPESTTDIDYFEAGDPVYIKYAFQNNGGVMIPDRFKVTIEYLNARAIFDSVLYNGIFVDSIAIKSLDDPLIMPEIDSLIINIKLDAGQNQDFGDDWEATWSDQNWVEDFETDNTISKTIYLGLQPPTNLEIEITPDRGAIDINWDGDINSTYKVYSSSDPYSGFEEDLTGTYSGTSWSAPLPAENRFYYVVEIDERHGRKSNIFHFNKSNK
jgi:hypothetical protein